MALTAQEMNNLRDLLEDVITRRVDPRFERIETRLDGIDVRLDGIDVRLDGIDIRLDGIDGRLERLEEDVTVVKDVVKDHSFEIARLRHKTA